MHTINQLLCHVGNLPDCDNMLATVVRKCGLDELELRIATAVLQRSVGTRSYKNTRYTVR